jgi:signal transduction histidine kinase
MEGSEVLSSLDLSKLQEELQVLDRIPLSFWMSLGEEHDYKIVFWNKGAEKNYGIPRSEALGESYIDLFVEEGVVAEQSKKDCDRVIAGDWEHPKNCLAIDENKEKREIIVLTNVFRYVHNGVPYQAEISVDLTRDGFLEFVDEEYMELREGPDHETQRTLKAFVDYMKNKIEQNLRLWSRTFAHEIRSELVAIKNAQEELVEKFEGIQEMDAFKQIERAHKALYLHSQNFLNARHLGARQHAELDTQFWLERQLEDTIDEFRYWAQMLSIELLVSNSMQAGTELKGTPDVFEHVVRNLLVNAIRHSGKNIELETQIDVQQLKVDIRCELDDEHLRISIVNVAQLTADELANMFKPFYKKPKNPDEGLHLGLSIAKQWVDDVGGTLDVTNLDNHRVVAYLAWPRFRRS